MLDQKLSFSPPFSLCGKVYIKVVILTTFKGIVQWHYVPSHHVRSPPSISRTLYWSESETLWPWIPIPHSPLCPAPGSHQYIFSVYEFDYSRSSFKWNHMLFGLLCLAYFIYNNVFKVHSFCSKHQNFLPFKGWLIFNGIDIYISFIYTHHIPYFIHPFIHQ